MFPLRVTTHRSTHLENTRFASVLIYGAWAALATHTLWAFFFYAIAIRPLALFNVVSVVLYVVCIALARRVRFSLALALTAVEVIAHAVFAVFMLGAYSAFHYYLFALAPLAFFSPRWRVGSKIALVVLLFLVYIGIDHGSRTYGAHIVLDVRLQSLMRHFNIGAVFGFLGYLAYYYARAARRAEERLDRLATTDPLTRLPNRRFVLGIAEQELARRRRSGNPLAIALIDADDFKALNDRYGHECGDEVLQQIAGRLRQSLRTTDHIGRWGGEEFVLLLPDTDIAGARGVAEKVRSLISGTPMRYKDHRLTTTVSIGVCELRADDSFAACLARADQALLEAKRTGKNRVVASTVAA